MNVRDIEAERAVLSDLLIDSRQAAAVRRIISPESFTSSAHRSIYRKILDLIDAGEEPDASSVRAAIADQVADASLVLGEILDLALPPSSAHAATHARQLASIAYRRTVRSRAAGLVEAARNGVGDRDLVELVQDLADEPAPHRAIEVTSLHSADVAPCKPEFTVPNLVRKAGLHLVWAQPGGHKTSLGLVVAHELMREHVDGDLFGHPELPIRAAWRRVLWIATEESEGVLAYRARAVRDGLGDPKVDGDLLYIFAAGRPRVTLDDLPALAAQHAPLDAVVLDSLTGLRPKRRDGERVKWDLDNDAANEQCLLLRGLAVEHDLAVVMMHHSDKTVTNYRGPTDWWASADVMLGLRAADGRVKVEPQKNRDGRVLAPFYLTPEWDEDSFRVTYDGPAEGDPADLPKSARRVLDYLLGAGPTPFYVIPEQLGMARSTAHKAVDRLSAAEMATKTGDKVKGSPVWQVSEKAIGHLGGANIG